MHDAGKPPQAPDPNLIIPLQSQFNRFNSSGPFGSQTWQSGGPGGHETLNTQVNPQMQGAIDRAFGAAATPLQREYIPQGMDQLASAILGKVGGHYGLSGNALNTNMQQQKPAAGMSPQPPQGVPGMGGGMPNLGYNTPGAGQAALMGSPMGPQVSQLNAGFGGPMTGQANPQAMMALRAMQGG